MGEIYVKAIFFQKKKKNLVYDRFRGNRPRTDRFGYWFLSEMTTSDQFFENGPPIFGLFCL